MVGQITIIFGPMFAEKTTGLLRTYNRIRHVGKQSCGIFKWKNEVRGSQAEDIVTHTNTFGVQNSVQAMRCSSLDEVSEQLWALDVIFIDEGQFFGGSAPLLLKLRDAGKRIYISMIIATFDQKLWPGSPFLELIQYATLKQKFAICDGCSDKNATHSYRKNNSTEVVQIGGTQEYGAACSDCLSEIQARFQVNTAV